MSINKRIDIVSIKMVKDKSILYGQRKISSPEVASELFKEFFLDMDREMFIVLSLDTKNQPVSINICSIGSLNASIVHPREVFKTAILSNAASIIVAHNHPSGNSTPSKEDINITERLKECGMIIGIPVVDHIVVGYEQFYSFKEDNKL